MEPTPESPSPFPFTLWDEDAQVFVCENCGAWAPEPGEPLAHNRTCKHQPRDYIPLGVGQVDRSGALSSPCAKCDPERWKGCEALGCERVKP